MGDANDVPRVCSQKLRCRMMSSPTVGNEMCLHIAAYMIGQKHRGIRFNSAASAVPICFYDLSDKGDPKDSKAQYGHVIMMFGGLCH